MSIKVVLFDLDGTLLPMNQGVFTKTYFGMIAEKLAPHGYEPSQLIDAIWEGTKCMVRNDGSKSNEEAFWEKFGEIYGDAAKEDIVYFDEFYRDDFDNVKVSCGYNPKAHEAVKAIKEMGFRTALATNPIFPAIATKKRTIWAGLSPDDFEYISTYENSCHSKPNPEYYRDIIRTLGVLPEECLMVGNDITEDMVAKTIGMNVFLITDCLINKEEIDISQFPNGDFSQLLNFISGKGY